MRFLEIVFILKFYYVSLSPLFSLSLSSLPPSLSLSHKKNKNKSLYWKYYDRECTVITFFNDFLKIHKIF